MKNNIIIIKESSGTKLMHTLTKLTHNFCKKERINDFESFINQMYDDINKKGWTPLASKFDSISGNYEIISFEKTVLPAWITDKEFTTFYEGVQT